MLFLWGLGGKAGFDINAAKADEPTGRDLSAGILSFGGIVFGSFSGVRTSSTTHRYYLLSLRFWFLVGSCGRRLQLPSSRRDFFLPRLHLDLFWTMDS